MIVGIYFSKEGKMANNVSMKQFWNATQSKAYYTKIV